LQLCTVRKTKGLYHPFEAGGIDTPRTLTKKIISKKMNIDILNLSKLCPELNITVRAADLTEMAVFIVSEAKRQMQQDLADAAAETYVSPQKTAEMLDVDISTLWRWKKRGYLIPIEVGGKRRYKMSDVKRILGEVKA